tara:strand:- start:10 stop:243 length:234 start_codon:yes stop_codon:yes gene_type:complete
MKILIGFLIALFISSQAYAQSEAEILGKGKVVSSQFINLQKNSLHHIVVVYQNKVYGCEANTYYNKNRISCWELKPY